MLFIILNILLVLTTSINANTIDSTFKGNLTSGFQKHLKNINKCCPAGKYVRENRSCVEYHKTFTFSNINVYDKELKYIGKSVEDVFDLVPNKFQDSSFKNEALNVILLGFNVYVTESGVLQLELPNAYNRWSSILPVNYCVDYRIMKDPSKITPRYWAVLPAAEIAQSNHVFTSFTLISCFFMLVVFIVYLMLPDLRNLPGMIVMAYVASLIMAFLLLAIIQMQYHTSTACIGLTMGIYFFFLSSFCWMSVMSYDIWWTFRHNAHARRNHRPGERFKFLMYCLYAWGVPLAMTLGLFVLNTCKNYLRDLPWLVTPHVPEFGCFLEGGVKLLYLYIPLLILILSNWIFYLMTAFSIWRSNRGTAILDSAAAGNQQAHRTQMYRLIIYLKLSVVMGLNWLLEVFSFLYPDFKMWYISDFYNILMGVAIFLIFVCKKDILNQLRQTYCSKKTTL